jgi:hypothetical protein
MIEQFDAILLHYVPNLIKDIHREKLAGNELSLSQRWNYVSKQLKLGQLLGQLTSVYSSQAPPGISSSPVNALNKGFIPSPNKPRSPKGKTGEDRKCFLCGKEGHWSKECPTPHVRKRSQSPRGSASSGFSRRSSGSQGRSSQSGSDRRKFDRARTPPRRFSRGQSPRGQSPRRSQRFTRSPRSSSERGRPRSGSSSSRSSGKTTYPRGQPATRSPRRQDSRFAVRPHSAGCRICGSKDHYSRHCKSKNKHPPPPRGRSPRGSHPPQNRHKVGFKLSRVEEDAPTSDWEGDVTSGVDDDALLAVRSMRQGYPSNKNPDGENSPSDFE